MPTAASPSRPDQILDAALAAFEARGFDAARVEDIAAAAGVSKGAVYLHFASKEALLLALIERHVAPIARAAAGMAAAGRERPLETLRLIMRTLPERLENPRVFAVPRLVISVTNRFPDIADIYRREVFDRVRDALTSLVEAAIAQGLLRPVSAASVVRSLMGGVLFEALRRHALRDPDAETLAAADHADFILGLLETEARA
jgi:AcrR family transcriptional regulator